MALAIVTGASRRFGTEVTEQFLDRKIGLFTVARKENDHLRRKAENHKLLYAHFTCDLSSAKDFEG